MSTNFTIMTDGQVIRYAVSCFNFAPKAFPITSYRANRTDLDGAIACLAGRGIEVTEQVGDQRGIYFTRMDDPNATLLNPDAEP